MSLKHEYNEILKLHDKAAEYLDNNNISVEQREKQIPQYLKVRYKLNALLRNMTEQGISYNEIDILYGFKEVS